MLKVWRKNPDLLLSKFSLDKSLEENIRYYKLWYYLTNKTYSYSSYGNLDKRSLDKNIKFLKDIYIKYEFLKSSTEYRESWCKMGLTFRNKTFYLGFHIPVSYIKNLDYPEDEPILVTDLFLFLDGYNMYGARTTRDIIHNFIHPHIGDSMCLGYSDLSATINHLGSNEYKPLDADLFWINLENHISHKTGDKRTHIFDISVLKKESTNNKIINYTQVESIIKNNINSILPFLDINVSKEQLSISIDNDKIIALLIDDFSYVEELPKNLAREAGAYEKFHFNGKYYSHIFYKNLYNKVNGNKKLYSNINEYLKSAINSLINLDLNKIYDDYKKITASSSDTGESVEPNQIFELQVS